MIGHPQAARVWEPERRHVAQGLTDRAIAARLWLTPKTVETHVRHILAKLDLPVDGSHNRRVLAVLAYLRRDGHRAALSFVVSDGRITRIDAIRNPEKLSRLP